MNENVIAVQELSKNFNLGKGKSISVLKNISFLACSNEFISIVGPSGSGKSTLLRCMSGLLNPTQGSVKLDAIDPYQLSPSKTAKMRRTKLGFIFQSYNLVPALPVFENVILPLRLSGIKIDRPSVERLLKSLNFTAKLTSFVGTLSGGEQQKVAIARVLVTRARIIFADEPTGAVDAKAKEIIFDRLRKLADNGACVIMVTHDVDLAARTDRALVLKDGQLIKTLTNPDATEILAAIGKG